MNSGFFLGRLTQGQLEQIPLDPPFSAEELGNLETVQQLRDIFAVEASCWSGILIAYFDLNIIRRTFYSAWPI